ncbi:MAG: cyclodeaminase/cyclohydrolase family protein [Clostridia bacterium]|jgi:formiminotetrahydrofolate cyclodeaminase|nr:cyclodeaminase/cyclohydrolase family protein [Clostridia bacterium]HPB17609.1 cyclodeaminase/cyclohydrolase family protein [Clostridia bacterium]HQM97201.1 cyclodeaminase/cyclohydrolase family protein [Clostridia bacterium]HQO70527.1 cyclodeaminase/cyclohydrolase family protein [Clostridia bacterium]
MFRNKSIEEFIEVLSSKEPVPGGGGASALAGTMGTALARMVGNLTLGKKKYIDVQEDISVLQQKTLILTGELMDLIDKDAEVFLPLSKAYSLPGATLEEREYKDRVMEEALNIACSVPVMIMEKSYQMLLLLGEYADKGLKIAISDVAVSSVMLRAAISGASVNVYINTKIMKDRNKAEGLNSHCDDLMQKGMDLADKIFERIEKKLR